MKIASFWHSGRLRNIDTLCLASWIEVGAQVDLYSFGPVEGVPDGVRLLPAGDVLAEHYLGMLKSRRWPERPSSQPLANYSDLFRIKLNEQERGLWLDTDVFLFRPFEFDPSKPFFAWEDRHRIGSPVFYLPSDSPMIADYNRVFDDPDLMPHWLGFKRRVLKPLLWRLQGKPFSPPDLGITIYGNDAFTRLAHKHGLTHYALGTRPFYAWNGKETLRFYDAGPVERIEDHAEVIGLHVHRKELSQIRPPDGSLYARMLDRLSHRLPPLTWQG